jgi:ribosome-binding protein aMBF1 (putative translation factor)
MTLQRKDDSMKSSKQLKLEKAGWKLGTATELLGLSAAEAAYVELKVRLAKELLDRRRKLGLSQKEVAGRVRSSQARVARMEGADSSVSLDLIVRSLLALGVTPTPLRDLIRL